MSRSLAPARVSARRVRLVFGAVLFLYALQLAFWLRFGEPYPALMMPSFSGTEMNAAGEMEVRGVDLVAAFENGEPVTLTAPRLLAEAPSSHFNSIALRLFPRNRPAATERPASRGALEAWLPGLAIRDARRFSSETTPEMARWLRDRLRELYPEREPRSVAFAWYLDRFDFSGGGAPARQRIPIETFTVELPR